MTGSNAIGTVRRDDLTRDFYQWFDLPERYRIDLAALDAAYRRVQAAVHPDRHAAGLDSERRLAMQMAAQANEAYQTLRDPVRRAAYLCGRRGVDLQAESNTSMPGEFLEQQMQVREALDDARESGDPAALGALRQAQREQRAALIDAIGQWLDDQQDPSRAAAGARQLMFLDRFGTELDRVEAAQADS